jgi:hypothetical protein
VEHADWMNEAVRQEIETLQRAYGFEENEAVAFWHLAEARRLMVDIAVANKTRLMQLREAEYEAEGLDTAETAERTGREIADAAAFTAEVETMISQHIHGLRMLLGREVLRRNFPEGWGWEFADEAEEEH